MSDIDTSLQQYLFGGRIALQEKQQLAAMLQRLAPRAASNAEASGVLPTWYGRLLELLTRHLRRPTTIGDELRNGEWLAEAALHKHPARQADAFGPTFDTVAAKLLTDVCGFLVSVGELNPDFRAFARAAFATTEEVSATSEAEPDDKAGTDAAVPSAVAEESGPAEQPRLPLAPQSDPDPSLLLGSLGRASRVGWEHGGTFDLPLTLPSAEARTSRRRMALRAQPSSGQASRSGDPRLGLGGDGVPQH